MPSGQIALPRQPPAREPETAARPIANPDIAFTSTDDGQYPLDSQIEIPAVGNLAGQAGTVSLWLQPEWGDGSWDAAKLVQLDDLQIVKDGHLLIFGAASDGGLGGLGTPIDHWSAGEWHQVTATWNGNQLALYLDGELVGSTVRDSAIEVSPDAKLLVGSDFVERRVVAPGLIEKVDVHNHPLTPAEVASEYLRAVG